MPAQEYTVRIARSISEIPRPDWEAVFPPVLESYAFLRTLDESGFDQFSFFYVVVYRNGVAVAATSCFTMHFCLYMTVQGFLKKVYAGLEKLFPGCLTPKILMVGLPMGMGRVGFAPGQEAALDVLCDTLEALARKEKASLINFKDFTAEFDAMLEPLSRRGYVKIESLPSTDMEVSFASFDEYLQSLGRVSRDGIKRNLKKADKLARFELEVTGSLSAAAQREAYALYLQTYEKLDMGLEKLPERFFEVLSAHMPQETKYFLWRLDGKPVAFALCLVRGEYFIDYYLGFDYSLAYDYNLYYVRFRDLLKWCISNGIKRYEMGVTSYESKRRLGFRFLRLFFYMKHCNPLINPFVRFFSIFMKPENFDPVFREERDRHKTQDT